jgi:hypothetical protein
MQVLGVLASLLPLIKTLYPEITEPSIKSDNVSCLASHDIIAYMHYLNKELADTCLAVTGSGDSGCKLWETRAALKMRRRRVLHESGVQTVRFGSLEFAFI